MGNRKGDSHEIGEEIYKLLIRGGKPGCIHDFRRKDIDDAVEYLYSLAFPDIVPAVRVDDGKAYSRGVTYHTYPNGAARVGSVDSDLETVEIPQVVTVGRRAYLVVSFNPSIIRKSHEPDETPQENTNGNYRLRELRFSSAIQDISSYSLYAFKELRRVTCESGSLFTVIGGNLYRRLFVPDNGLELIWFSPFFSQPEYVAPENIVEFRNLPFTDEKALPAIRLPQQFWKRRSCERKFVALNGNFDLFLSEGALVLKQTDYNEVNDESFIRSVVRRIQQPSKVLHIITPIARDGINLRIVGMDLDRVYDEVEEIYIHVIRSWGSIADWWAAQDNFIKDSSKLPNLRKYECLYDDACSLVEIRKREEGKYWYGAKTAGALRMAPASFFPEIEERLRKFKWYGRLNPGFVEYVMTRRRKNNGFPLSSRFAGSRFRNSFILSPAMRLTAVRDGFRRLTLLIFCDCNGRIINDEEIIGNNPPQYYLPESRSYFPSPLWYADQTARILGFLLRKTGCGTVEIHKKVIFDGNGVSLHYPLKSSGSEWGRNSKMVIKTGEVSDSVIPEGLPILPENEEFDGGLGYALHILLTATSEILRTEELELHCRLTPEIIGEYATRQRIWRKDL